MGIFQNFLTQTKNCNSLMEKRLKRLIDNYNNCAQDEQDLLTKPKSVG